MLRPTLVEFLSLGLSRSLHPVSTCRTRSLNFRLDLLFRSFLASRTFYGLASLLALLDCIGSRCFCKLFAFQLSALLSVVARIGTVIVKCFVHLWMGTQWLGLHFADSRQRLVLWESKTVQLRFKFLNVFLLHRRTCSLRIHCCLFHSGAGIFRHQGIVRLFSRILQRNLLSPVFVNHPEAVGIFVPSGRSLIYVNLCRIGQLNFFQNGHYIV